MTNLSSSLIGFLFVFAVLAQDAASTTTQVIQAGVVDAFALPADPASPSADLQALLGAFQAFDRIAGVNGGTADTQVAHTFTGLPADIVAGTIEVRVRAGVQGGVLGVNTDGIVASFAESGSPSYVAAVAWARTFGVFVGGGVFGLTPDPGLVQSTTWSTGDDATLLLNLAALPLNSGGTLNLIPQLNSHQFVDVNITDETGADYMILTLEVADPVLWEQALAIQADAGAVHPALLIGLSPQTAAPTLTTPNASTVVMTYGSLSPNEDIQINLASFGVSFFPPDPIHAVGNRIEVAVDQGGSPFTLVIEISSTSGEVVDPGSIVGFNPQPEPPAGSIYAFNPQPEPPAGDPFSFFVPLSGGVGAPGGTQLSLSVQLLDQGDVPLPLSLVSAVAVPALGGLALILLACLLIAAAHRSRTLNGVKD